MLSFTLIEALLFDRVHLTGGAAMLMRWGGRNEFAVTLGGFHPSFRPFIPEGLREPPRLGAYWKPHHLVELSIKAYFALTSTSLQFGFAAHVEAGASWGGFRADAEFNFLVMTDPDTRFELDLSFRVTVSLCSARPYKCIAQRIADRTAALDDRRIRLLGGVRRQHFEGLRTVRLGRQARTGRHPATGSADR